MHPTIHLFGNYAINSYSLFTTLGAVLFAAICYREAVRLKFPLQTYWQLVFMVAVGAIIGSKICFALFFDSARFFSGPFHTLLHTGWMFYGSFIGGYAALLIGRAMVRFPLWTALDGMSYGAIAGLGMGRIGCYMGGCCYGTGTDAFCGVQFPGLPGPVHPTQLYEAVAAFALFGAMYLIRKKITFNGMQFSIMLIGYGLFRFLVEFIRNERGIPGFQPFTPSQYISLVLILAGIYIVYKKHPRALP